MNGLIPIRREKPVGRYAPSPTGDLHLGNLRTALLAWEDCRRAGGSFILRIEDIDTPRVVAGSEERMLDDLRWLGLDWDEGPDIGGPAGPYRQSERGDFYAAALRRLEERGMTYLCTCSRKDLREASAPHDAPGELAEAVYSGKCRSSDPALQRLHPAGAAVRFRVGAPPVEFEDLILGPQCFDLGRLCGDFIIRRRDGLWAYQLACAVDDALMGVTRVVRGADLLSSAPRQLAVIRALELPEPRYGHVPLVAGDAGKRMAKRDGSASIRAWRNQGMSPSEARERIRTLPIVPL
ncbi:tRNA glutamyl-Q(34) synthetase GluQRS [Candidatus Sumerlaeota bacterium]|nr:tRNA glutamyl-Q(34) synthetase GluQRS [Candidatus Sumerlaeota bacterium]